MLFNHGWEFAKNEPDHFTPVRLPHDWLIEDPRHLYERGIGYYRRMLRCRYCKARTAAVYSFRRRIYGQHPVFERQENF